MNRQPPIRRLSIGTTFYKKVFPWIFVAAAALAFITAAWASATGRADPAEVLPFAAVAVIVSFILRLIGTGLVDEVLDGGDHLVVRKDGLVEHVPLSTIDSVKESLWRRQGPPQILLVLEAPTPLGRVIAFIPTNHSKWIFNRSPLYYELTDRVRRAHLERDAIRSRRKPT